MILKFIGEPDDGGTVEIDAEEFRRSEYVMVATPKSYDSIDSGFDTVFAPIPGIARYRKGEIGDLIFDGYE